MKIDVTQEHIDKGNGEIDGCMVFLALRDAGIKACTVGFAVVRLEDGTAAWIPEWARPLIKDHIYHRGVKPFSFELDYNGTPS